MSTADFTLKDLQKYRKNIAKFRRSPEAKPDELNLADWIIGNSQNYYSQKDTRDILFTKQNLLDSGPICNLMWMPKKQSDQAFLYINVLEGADNPATIGCVPIGGDVLYIYPDTKYEGGKLMSVVIAESWCGYYYDGSNYQINCPS